ncbi:NAD(P)/FAD-dependent oxidoreductase [Pseudomonas huanghezhanensis]|uniref:NAD(P)/FAD-dependent oxidoreductase n=1 Tax=Pseudomonas huanghezhanensis TaxID=3002903 RepID=UPI002286A0E3|nr:FAD-dependent oxidoreductase [Pseudomonas sp. BSw22131]
MDASVIQPMVIIGAGHAGGRAALTLREAGFAGRIVLIGDEVHLPYERPPLSKALLKGESSLQGCSLFDEARLITLNIEHRSGVRVLSVVPLEHQVVLSNGLSLEYSKLLLATGGSSRILVIEAGQSSNVHYLRTVDDALRLQSVLRPGTRLVIVGGGFIGLEVAATAREQGCEVEVIEAGSRLAARALHERLSAELLTLHRRKGVRVHLSAVIESVQGDHAVQSLTLASGETLTCDVMLVGIGMQPNVQLACDAGLATGSGVKVDRYLQTSAPDIYAAGDVCEFQNALGQFQRQETWRNAETQGRLAALNMLGQQLPFSTTPGFWSDHYEYGLQTVGAMSPDALIVERAVKGGGFLLLYLDPQGCVAGASGWGQGNSVAKDIKVCERLIESGISVSPEALADPEVGLKQLLRGEHA